MAVSEYETARDLRLEVDDIDFSRKLSELYFLCGNAVSYSEEFKNKGKFGIFLKKLLEFERDVKSLENFMRSAQILENILSK